MNYKVTYSEDILQHHGILGQKWGIRRYQNSDGSLTAAGQKRYASKTAEALNKTTYKNFWDAPENLVKDKGTSAALKQIHEKLSDSKAKLNSAEDEADEIMDGYFKDKDLMTNCGAIAGLANDFNDGKDPTVKEALGSMWFYSVSDGDQSDLNGVSVYLRNQGLYDKGVKTYQKYMDAEDDYKKNAESVISQTLGDHANDPVRTAAYSSSSVTLGKDLTNQYLRSDFKVKSVGAFCLEEGTQSISASSNESIKKATNIVSKLGLTNSNAKNLYGSFAGTDSAIDYGGKHVSEMTDSDWAEVSKLINQ